MKTAPEIPFPTFSRIYPGQAFQLAAWSQQFQLPEKELYSLLKIAGPFENDGSGPLQKFPSSPERSTNRAQLLFRFQTFIDAAIEDRRQDYKRYAAAGGKAGFYEHSWLFLLKEATEEAARLLNEYDSFGDKENLLRDLKRIAEGYLLVLDKVLA